MANCAARAIPEVETPVVEVVECVELTDCEGVGSFEGNLAEIAIANRYVSNRVNL